MRQVRAKFRCMSVMKKWDGTRVVELQPVLQRGTNPENAKFWKFTPGGNAELSFKGPSFDDRGKEYVPGDYYYIDMHKDLEEGGWVLSEVSHSGQDTGGVKLCTNNRETVAWGGGDGFSYGRLNMNLDHAPALEWFDKAGESWSVKFTWAEATDD